MEINPVLYHVNYFVAGIAKANPLLQNEAVLMLLHQDCYSKDTLLRCINICKGAELVVFYLFTYSADHCFQRYQRASIKKQNNGEHQALLNALVDNSHS